MMESFRKFGATKVSKAILLVLTASFAAWGIGDYLMPNMGAEALTVNGEKISPQAVEQTFKQRMENISQLLGGRPTQEQMDQMQVPEQIVTEVVARTVLRQAAEKLGFQPSTKQLQDEIAMVSAFKNEKGEFDVARYRQILAQVGRTPAQFEHDLGQDIIVRNLAQLAKMEMPDQKIAALVAASENVPLTLDVASLSPAHAGAMPEPKAGEIEKFHADNSRLYSKPEMRDLVVLRLSRDDIIRSIEVPEKDIRAAYEENKDAYRVPEKRVVRHILVDSREDAQRIAAKIKNLSDFTQQANAESKDPGNKGGGMLGPIQEKDVVPAFGKAAFSLPVNTLSAPVQSNYGWHLIWVDSIEPSHAMSFDEMKAAIATDLQASQADEALVRLSGQVDEKIAAGEPLSKIAADIGMKPVQYNMVTAADEGVEPHELEAGFGVNKGETSTALPMKDGGVAYVQAVDVTAAKVEPLDTVKARVVADWKQARAQDILRQNAEKLMAAARAPGTQGDLRAIAAKAGVSAATQPMTIKMPADAPEWLQRSLLEVYPLPDGSVLPRVLNDRGTWYVVRLAHRQEVRPNPADLPAATKIYQQRLQGDVEALLMGYLTQQARVTMNQANLKQIFGREVEWDVTQ